MPYADAASEFTKLAGFAPSRATFSRWISVGILRGGSRVKLAARRVGGRWIVPAGAVAAFLAELNAA